MQHQIKGRAEMLKKFNKSRKLSRIDGFNDPAIILGSKGGLTRKKVRQAVDRMKLKRELRLGEKIPHLNSVDNVMISSGLKIQAIDVAARLSSKYLLKPLKLMGLTQPQLKAFEALIIRRTDHMIKGTNIPLTAPVEFMLMNLINSFGEKGFERVGELSKKLTQRGESLRKLTNKSDRKSDAFYNIHPRVATIQGFTTQISAEDFGELISPTIREREIELEQLRKTNIPQKERYVKLLEEQIKKARRNYVLFRQNNLS
jgi:hypothetical protein